MVRRGTCPVRSRCGYVKIAASRTWDYRIALQVQAADGTLYELFTQFAGIGKQNVEHLEVTDIGAEAEIIEVAYHDMKEDENVELQRSDSYRCTYLRAVVGSRLRRKP
jgi:hypothetical protein